MPATVLEPPIMLPDAFRMNTPVGCTNWPLLVRNAVCPSEANPIRLPWRTLAVDPAAVNLHAHRGVAGDGVRRAGCGAADLIARRAVDVDPDDVAQCLAAGGIRADQVSRHLIRAARAVMPANMTPT